MNTCEERMELNEAVRKLNLDAYEEIYGIRPRIDPHENEKYMVKRARDGAPVLFIHIVEQGADRWIPMDSMYSPVYEAGRWAKGIELTNFKTVLAVLGFGMGYHLKALMETLREDTDIMVYEPEEGLFAFVSGFADLRVLFSHDRVYLILPSDIKGGYYNYLEQYAVANKAQVHGVRLPYYSDDAVFDKACERIGWVMKVNRTFQRVRGRKALTNRLCGWVRLQKNAIVNDLFARLPRSLPVVVVAGGPSLNKNAAQLKELHNKALIVCIDRAVHTLDSYGVKPDLLITLDVEKPTGHLIVDSMPDVQLLCAFQANKETQKHFDGRMIYYHAWIGEDQLPGIGWRIFQQGDIGSNVAGGAFSTFIDFGSETIIFVGQDLAMLGNQSHADGSDEGVSYESKVMEVEGVFGEPVLTRRDWVSFRDDYEKIIKRHPDSRVIDATEGGALIHGTEVMSLRQVIDEICTTEYDVDAMLGGVRRAQTEEEHEETIRMMNGWVDDLGTISGLSVQLTEICDQLMRECKYHDILDARNRKKLEQFARLRRQVMDYPVYKVLVDQWFEEKNLIPDDNFIATNNDDTLPILEQSLRFYNQLKEDCRTFSEAINEAISEA